jgi:glycine cleavage system aminomethyltransferase T
MMQVFAPVARTPLYAWHAARGAIFTEQNGWLIPSAYAAVGEKATATSELAVADISAVHKISLRGRGVVTALRKTFEDRYRGGVLALPGKLGWLCGLTDTHCLLLATGWGPDHSAAVGQFVRNLPDSIADTAFDVTSAYAAFAIVGNGYGRVLNGLTSLDLDSALPPGSCTETGLSGVHALLIRPEGPAVYLCVGWDTAEFVWEQVWNAGRRSGMALAGMDTVSELWKSAP